MLFRSTFIMTMAICFTINSAVADELKIRSEILHEVSNMFLQSNFEELEALSEQYRTTQERTESGLWKLTRMYFALSQVITFRTVSGVESKWYNQKTKEYLEEFPNSPTAIITRAIYLEKTAWNIRGRGWASNVLPEAWSPFKRKLREIDKFLIDNKETAKSDPHWFTIRARIQYALFDDPNEFTENLEEGRSKYPDYYQLYFESVYGLLPKWRGSPQHIENFARSAVQNSKNTEGKGMYTRIYWYIHQVLLSHESLFDDYDVNWPMMKDGMLDILDTYPDQWNIQNFAYLSCEKNDSEMTQLLMDKITSKPYFNVWGNGRTYEICRKI